MFKEVVDLFQKLVSPSTIQSQLLRNIAVPIDIVSMMHITKNLDTNPSSYYKVLMDNDIIMILYKGLYKSHNMAIIEDVMLKDGKPVLCLVLDSDVIMEGSDDTVISTIFAVSLTVTCFFKAKYSMFLYNSNGVIGKVFDESAIILFIALVLAVFRKSDELYDIMLTCICQVNRYHSFSIDDLRKHIEVINDYGVDFLLDNSGIGGKNE